MSMFELRFPEGVSRESFLSLIWQKKPLLMRGALIDFPSPLTPDELAGLACEDEIESRIVLEQGDTPWQIRRGPFDETDFADLPDDRPWTLLVQDVDKYLPAVRRLLGAFEFLPGWRIDDVMISFANPGGSVGPHIDQYDVFLFQAEGRRRWQFGAGPVTDAPLRSDTELRILSEFEPEFDLVLEPGDVLYLPPGVPHWGVALEDCLTYSIGFHAPSYTEMLTDWCQFQLDKIDQGAYFRDPPIASNAPRAEISDAAFTVAERALEQMLATNSTDRRRWFGRLITQVKPHLAIDPRTPEVDKLDFKRQLVERTPLHRHPYARLAFADLDSQTTALFVNGHSYELPIRHRGFVLALANNQILHHGFLAEWLDYPDCVDLITGLYNAGYLDFDDESS
jgi:50S ribosomal protein L16 3-hydroxylase